jgi:hypothetical protein
MSTITKYHWFQQEVYNKILAKNQQTLKFERYFSSFTSNREKLVLRLYK